MSFDSSLITEVFPPTWQGGRLVLSWISSVAPGTYFQVYVAGTLVWYGTDRHTTIAVPSGPLQIDIGAVGPGEQATDLSSGGYDLKNYNVDGYDTVPFTPIETRAFLSWQSIGAAGFHVYEGATGYDMGVYSLGGYEGSAGTLVGDITSIEHGLSTGGYDMGGYNQGGYDILSGTYSWTSKPLTRGIWNFSVRSYDAAGNEGTPVTTSVAIAAPPKPPAVDSQGKRLEYTYNQTTKQVTLAWLPSPG
jgi:hypothetical protein